MPGNLAFNGTEVQKQLEAPMPWIGMYVAAASLLCTVATAADVLHGLRSRKYWFPSKYFSLNATSLTFLAVALKLPVDLTTRMYAATDRLAKVSSLAFMSTAMANFLTSLGSMDDKDVLMNGAALGILVITVTANVCIQVVQMRPYRPGWLVFTEEVLAICAMLLLLAMFTSSALMILSTKRYLENKYREMHKSAVNEEQADMRRVGNDKLKVLIKKYWLMAETSSPQFVIARSATCNAAGVLSLLVVLILVEAEVRMAAEFRSFRILEHSDSSYEWSTKYILLTQTIGVVVGTIAPASRWLIAINIRSSNEGSNGVKSAFTVEGYWTQKMVEWKRSSLPLQIRHLKSRKLLHDLKGLVLDFFFSIQCLTVLASKLVLLISIFVTSPIILCLNYGRRLKRRTRIPNSVALRNEVVSKSSANLELDIRHYVMLLEREVELPQETLENIYKEVDQVIERGKMHKPNNLLKLLSKLSCNFRGVTEFDSPQVPNLPPQDLPYCWSLPVVTLACIALALPNVEKNKSNILLNSVTEGLRFVKLIDKALDAEGDLANIRGAAKAVWVTIELHHKWQDKDLLEASLKGQNAEEILQQLCEKAEKTVQEFKRNSRDCVMRNPLNWPEKVIAANSMYRIGRTVLLNHGGDSDKTDEELFERLSIMIADILAACLTNLAQVITMKCHRNAIEEREKSVREAALLLGEAEDILRLLQQHELPFSMPDQAAQVKEWRAIIEQQNQDRISGPHIDTDDRVTIEVGG